MAKIKNNKIKIEVSKGIFLDLVGSLKKAVDENLTAKEVISSFNIEFRKNQIKDLQDSIDFCRAKKMYGFEIPENYYNYLIDRLVKVVEK